MLPVVTAVIGFIFGATFYAWWVKPDLDNQRRIIAELRDHKDRLSHELLKAKNFTVTQHSIKNNKPNA
jgi:hypothetical protein